MTWVIITGSASWHHISSQLPEPPLPISSPCHIVPVAEVEYMGNGLLPATLPSLPSSPPPLPSTSPESVEEMEMEEEKERSDEILSAVSDDFHIPMS